MRQFDFASASLGSLAVVLVLHLLVLLAVAGALGAWALGMQVRLAELELPGVEPVLVGLPASTCGQGTSPWVAALLQLFGILPLLLLAYATASALILSPILAWSRHRRVNLRKAAVTLGVFPVAASLAFATNEGYVLWRGLADSLRYLLLPLGVALLLRTGVKTVGAGGLADHITAYSALKVGPWWRVLVRWVLPTGLLILALYRGMAYCEGHDYEPLGCSLFLAPLVLLPLAAWSAKSFANRGRR